jgi:Flp pilus assembly protein TadG
MASGNGKLERGVVLVAFALASAVIIGGIGLSFDLGRLFIVRNEAQAYADAAALAAVAQLDGTAGGLTRGATQAQRAWSQWHFGLQSFTAPTITWCSARNCPATATSDPLVARFAHVRTNGSTVPTHLIGLLTGTNSNFVNAEAIAGQLLIRRFTQDLFPFMIISHNLGANFNGDCGPSTADPHCGLLPGQEYTFRWGSNAQVNMSQYISSGGNPQRIAHWCLGDRGAFADQLAAAIMNCAGCGSTYLTRSGFVQQPDNPGAGTIQALITQGYQSQPYGLGDEVGLWNGQIQAAIDDVEDRAARDTNGGRIGARSFPPANQTSPSRANTTPGLTGPPFPDRAIDAYLFGEGSIPQGNFARRVIVPIVSPAAFINPNNATSEILAFFSFLLYPAEYYDGLQGGNNPWCFVYEGPAEITGGPAPYDSGVYMIRLVG